jgi:hypothetical protein
MSDLTECLLDHVRTLLRAHPAFTGVRRDDLDVYLGDLERDIRFELEDWAAGVERGAYVAAREDLDCEAEERAAAEKAKRAKRAHTREREKRA